MEGLVTSSVAFGTLAGARVFLTGHTGFKGSWLALWLHRLGASTYGFSLPPPTEPGNFVASGIEELLAEHVTGDVRDRGALAAALDRARPHVVFHLAAQALVMDGYENPYETFATNVMGTAALLEAIRTARLRCAVVVVTSDKCYRNQEEGAGYRESDPLGGSDPYSASKGAAELVAGSYRDSFFPPSALADHGVRLATARAGNVIGGGDWSPNRLMVDIVRHLERGEPIALRNPQARRPFQHVLEPLAGYLALAQALMADDGGRHCTAFNFGPPAGAEASVQEMVETSLRLWPGAGWLPVAGNPARPEARVLRLAADRAMHELGWLPRWTVAQAVERTLRWHRRFVERGGGGGPGGMREECERDLADYESAMRGGPA